MSHLNEITSWQTTDGRIFEDRSEAEDHQAILNFDTEYAKHPLWDPRGGDVDPAEVREWLINNKNLVAALLGLEIDDEN